MGGPAVILGIVAFVAGEIFFPLGAAIFIYACLLGAASVYGYLSYGLAIASLALSAAAALCFVLPILVPAAAVFTAGALTLSTLSAALALEAAALSQMATEKFAQADQVREILQNMHDG